jgi:hypothetical protein
MVCESCLGVVGLHYKFGRQNAKIVFRNFGVPSAGTEATPATGHAIVSTLECVNMSVTNRMVRNLKEVAVSKQMDQTMLGLRIRGFCTIS